MNEDRKIPHPTDTHPPLELRLKQLGTGMSECLRLLDSDGGDSTLLLEGHFENVELELNDIEHTRVSQILNVK